MSYQDDYSEYSSPRRGVSPGAVVLVLLILLTFGILLYFLLLGPSKPKPQMMSSIVCTLEAPGITSSDLAESGNGSSLTSSAASGQSSSVASSVSSGAQVGLSDQEDEVYFRDAVFVGDSLTVAMGLYGLVDQSRVVADIGVNLDQIMTREYIQASSGSEKTTILDAVKAKSPKKIYCMLGTNGIAWITPDTMIKRYETFVSSLKSQNPDAIIYLVSIPPVTKAKETSDSRFANSKIRDYNQKLLSLAQRQGVYFLDAYSVLVNDSGVLSTDIAEKDGVHLIKSAYQTIISYYLTHTVKE